MPEISRFLGIVVQMYFEDHLPSHFHARYGEFRSRSSSRTASSRGGSRAGPSGI